MDQRNKIQIGPIKIFYMYHYINYYCIPEFMKIKSDVRLV